MDKLENEYKDDQQATKALGGSDPKWLRDRKVQRIQDLDSEGYSIMSQSSTELDTPIDDEPSVSVKL